MLKLNLKTALILFLFFLALPISAFSSPSALYATKIINALSVMQGVLIKTKSNIKIINKGLKDNVKKGDVWTIYSKGEQIIDPSSGKVLGVLPVPIAVCRVIKTEASFSEVQVKPLKNKTGSKPHKIKSGNAVSRFSDIDTVFMDIGGKHYSLYRTLRAKLPSLNWKGYKKINKRSDALQLPYGVLILTDNNGITVWSGGEILLMENYSDNSPMPAVSKTQTASKRKANPLPPAAVSANPPTLTAGKSSTSLIHNPSPVVIPGLSGKPSFKKNEKKPTLTRPNITPGLASDIAIKNYRSAGTIDKIVLNMGIMTPALNGDDMPFFVYLSGQTVFADSIDGKQHYKYNYNGFGEILNMITGKNHIIILNIFVKDDNDMESRILSFGNNGFSVVARDINYILSMIDTNGDGINDTLYGQEFDSENFLGANTYRLSLKSGEVQRVGKIPSLPSFNIMGAFICDLNGNGIQDIGFYDAGRKFVIYEKNKKIWEASSIVCGSVRSILYDDPLSTFNVPKQISIWSMPAIINSDGKYFAAIPANESGLLSVVGGGPEKGGLGILSQQGNNYILRKINSQFQGAIQSVFTYDNELYISVIEGNLFTDQGKTDILALPLNEAVGK